MTPNPNTSRTRVNVPGLVLGSGDILCLNLGFAAAFALRFGSDVQRVNILGYAKVAPAFSAVFLLLLLAFDLYRRRQLSLRATVLSLARPLIITALFGASFVLFAGAFAFPRTVILLGFPLGGLFVLGWRISIAKLEKRLRGEETVVAVINKEQLDNDDQRQTLRRLSDLSDHGALLTAVLDHQDKSEIIERGCNADIVVLTAVVPQASRSDIATGLLEQGTRVLFVPAALDVSLKTGTASEYYSIEGIELGLGDVPTLTRAVKRLVDISVATTLGLLLLPLIGLLMAAVKLDSPGRAIFRQERTGLDQRRFSIIKLRTMTENAEAQTGPIFAKQGDPRITRLGKWLRKSRLDEIPQLWNVLVGDMSLIGPRPERPEFVAVFSKNIPGYSRRFTVRPGVTGLAQVRAGYTASPEEKLRYDLLYINQLTTVGDIRIAIQTLATMIDFDAAEGTIDLSSLPSDVEELISESDEREKTTTNSRTSDAHAETSTVVPLEKLARS